MRNTSEAFSFVFRDSDWPVKILIGSLFTLLSIILIGIPVVYGYLIELLKRVRRNDPRPLPEWKDAGILFVTGIKYLFTLLVYYITLAFLILPVVFLLVVTGACTTHFGGPAFMPVFPAFFLLPMIGLAFFYSLVIAFLTPFITIQFAANDRITDGLRLGAVLAFFRRHWQDGLLVVVLSFVVSIAAAFGIILFIIGVFATSFYSHCVVFHCYGQIARTADEQAQQSAHS